MRFVRGFGSETGSLPLHICSTRRTKSRAEKYTEQNAVLQTKYINFIKTVENIDL